jgi:putative membrane protein
VLLNGIRGFCMAMADSVPGVSGGTIAFLLGFYDEFINSLNDLMGKDNARRKQAFFFLFKLGVGWVAGFCLSVLVLSGLFQEHIYEISSVFMGLTFFAVPMVIREEKDSIRGRYGNLVFTVLGIGLVFCISYFNPAGGQGMNVSVEHLSMGLVAYVFLTAMVAITAMVLPGISGSTLLLIFGIYVPIIGAVKELLHMNLNYVPILLVFGMGVITGIVGIIKTIKMCLERYRSQTIYAILGLMIGSLYAITKGPTTLDVPMEPLGLQTFSILFFLLGGLILAGLEVLKTRLEK